MPPRHFQTLGKVGCGGSMAEQSRQIAIIERAHRERNFRGWRGEVLCKVAEQTITRELGIKAEPPSADKARAEFPDPGTPANAGAASKFNRMCRHLLGSQDRSVPRQRPKTRRPAPKVIIGRTS